MHSVVAARCAFGKCQKIEAEDDKVAYMEYPDGKMAVFACSTGEFSRGNNRRLEIVCDRGLLIMENVKIRFLRNEIPLSEFCATAKTLFDEPGHRGEDIPLEAGGGRTSQTRTEKF